MRIIDRYICLEILSAAFLGLVICTFVFFVPQLVQMMGLVVRQTGAPWEVVRLFASAFPGVLSFSLPISVLVGVLIGLGRMSADSELIAMNALGMGWRRLLVPISAFAIMACGATLAMTLWLGPVSIHTMRGIEEHMRASEASSEVQPRVFDERYPNLVLYVQDVSAAATQWRGVFLAEIGADDVSHLTLADKAIVIADRAQGKLELHLRDGSVHDYSLQDPNHYGLSAFAQRDLSVAVHEGQEGEVLELTDAERSMASLRQQHGPNEREAQVEFQRRLAFPGACLAFAFIALPVGSQPRRGGRTSGFLTAVAIVCGYYLVFTVGAGFAREGKLPAWAGIWAANIAISAIGLALLPRIERMHDEGRLSHALARWTDWHHWKIARHARLEPASAEKKIEATSTVAEKGGRSAFDVTRKKRTGGGFPQFLDFYLLRNFLFYFALLLVGFVLLFEVFTFFDLLNDIARHRTGLMDIVNYFRYLCCYLFYQLAPLACLVAILVTLGVMAKNNELVAFKAAGVSLYRIALPLLMIGIIFAVVLVILDDTYLPYANQRQNELRNIIKGRPAQTYFRPGRQWIFGNTGNDPADGNAHGNPLAAKIYNYRFFDPDRQLFGDLSVYELDPRTFSLRRRVYAARAHWEPLQNAWILESGWVRDFQDGRVSAYFPFPVYELPELDEPPAYFHREVRQAFQMNWWQLRNYIVTLRQAGFDVAALSVQLQKKISFPLIAPIIIMLAIPFSILVGTRGALGGVVVGVGLGVVYWAVSALFEAMGAVGQLPALMAAWSPDVIFLFLGLYFFLKMPT